MQRKADKMSSSIFFLFVSIVSMVGYAEYQRGTGKYLGHCSELDHFNWL